MATNTGKKPWGFFSAVSGMLLKVGLYKNKDMAQKAATRMGEKYDSHPSARKRVAIKVKEIKGKAK